MGPETLALTIWMLLGPSAPPGDVAYINRRDFKIPIQTDPARRAEMRELLLYASTDQGATWNQVASATPDKEAFSFHAPADGTYWFNVVVIDVRGERQPPDIYKVPPAQKVVVDTLRPVLRIVTAERQGDEVVVAWEVQDDHADLSTLKLEYRPAEMPEGTPGFSALVSPVMTGQTRFRYSGSAALHLRMQVQDYAGNQTVATRDLAAVPVVAAPPPTFPPAPATPAASPMPLPASYPGADHVTQYQPPPRPAYPPPYPPAPYPSAEPNFGESARVIAAAGPSTTSLTPSGSNPPPPTPAGQLPPLQLINKKQFALEYEVIREGPSKLSAVELWVTQDNGQTWRLLGEDPDLQSPIMVELPGEGIYGLRLVFKSGAGLSDGPPQPGDLPEVRVELDTTAPTAQLREPIVDPQRRDTLLLTWSASDRNLAPNPITLQWAEQAQGPWNLIGTAQMTNAGRFHWQLPLNLPARVYLRLIVRDLAGNVTEAITRDPVLVDLVKPAGRIKGFTSITPQP